MFNKILKIPKIIFAAIGWFFAIGVGIIVVDNSIGWRNELVPIRNASVSIGAGIIEKSTPVVEVLAKTINKKKRPFLLKPVYFLLDFVKKSIAYTVLIFVIPISVMYLIIYKKHTDLMQRYQNIDFGFMPNFMQGSQQQ